MQELVRQQGQVRPSLVSLPANGNEMDLLQAASGCRESYGQAELEDFHAYAEKQKWIWRNNSGDIKVHLSGHMYVDEHTRRESMSQQGFIALWFDEAETRAASDTIEGAIRDAGYTPLRIDSDPHTSSIPDQVVHQLRQSRFVVADLTGHLLCDSDELGRRNVYYEAGFAAGADLEVIFTCREDCLRHPTFPCSALGRPEPGELSPGTAGAHPGPGQTWSTLCGRELSRSLKGLCHRASAEPTFSA